MSRCPARAFVLASMACVPSGCIPLPGVGRVSECPDFRPLVGDRTSSAPIRPGYATRDSVRHLLGRPDREWADGSIVTYRYTTEKGSAWVVLMRDGVNTFHQDRFLFLRFAPDGVLAELRVVSEPYFDNNRYDYEGELRAFVAATDPHAAGRERDPQNSSTG